MEPIDRVADLPPRQGGVLLAQAEIPFAEVQLKFADDNRVIGVDYIADWIAATLK